MLNGSLSRKTWLSWVALGVGLLATVFISLQVKQRIEQDMMRQFAFDCDQITLKIQERLGDYALILRGSAALFAASKTVDRKEWRAYVEKLQADRRLPGAQGIGFASVIPAAELAAHIAAIRAEGFPGYTVRPPGERGIYAPVTYLEPFRDRNLRAFGYDMFAEPVRRAALEQSRDTGEATLSGKVELVQETCLNVQAGVLMYVPVYRSGAPVDTIEQRRAALSGWVYSPYRMNDLMAGLLREWLSHEGKTVHLSIYDGLQATPATLLFGSKPANLPDVPSLFTQQRTINFNGHQWLLAFELTGKSSDLNYTPAWATLTGGLALSALLFGLILSAINTRINAVRIAGKLTEDIKHSQELLKEGEAFKLSILNSLAAEIVVVDRDWLIRGFNEPWLRSALEFGIEPGKPAPPIEVGDNYLSVCQAGTVSSSPEALEARNDIRAVLDGKLPSFSLEYHRDSQEKQRWFTMTITPLGQNTISGVVITHTDITERKRMETAIAESQNLLRMVIDTAPTRVFWKDRNLSYLGCNMAFAKDAGMTHPEDVIGKDDYQMGWADQAQLYRVDDRAVMESGIARLSYDEPQTTPSGQVIWLRTSKVPLRNQDNEVFGLLGIYEDITERKLLEDEREEALSRLQKIASRVPGVVYQYRLRSDGSSCMPFASEAIREMFHVSPEEIRMDASKVFAMIHPDDYDEFVASIEKSARNLTPWRHECRVKYDDGTECWLFGNSLPEREADGSILWHGFITDVTERRHAEEALHKISTAVEQSPVSIVITDITGAIEYVNPAFTEITGYTSAEAMGQNPRILKSNEFALEAYKELWHTILSGEVWRGEFHNKKKNGEFFWEQASISPIRDVRGVVTSFVAVKEDITERKQIEEKLQLAASVFIHASEGIMIIDANYMIIDVNDAFCDITGYSRDEVLSQNPRLLKSILHETEFYDTMWRDLIEKGHWFGELWNRRKNGEVYAVMQSISAVRDAQGNTRQYVALFSDITPLKEHERQLENIAHYDALTSLPNRVLLADRLHQAMAQVRRRRQWLAVAFLDLDGFKAINDNYGHEAGDQLLISLANSMAQTQREGDTLARLGGDEFVAVLLDLVDIETSVPMLTRLLAAAAQPVQYGNIALQVSASLGVTFYPQAEEIDADQLLRQADQAMYQAKLEGKNRYHVFDAKQDSSVRGHHESLERIRRALTEREFVLYYQPKVNMRSGKIIGAEALIRWQHPERGLLLPDLFLPVINNHPLAIEVGDWVIDSALTQMTLWHAAGLDIQVSVNVGARQLQQADFVERLRVHLAAHPEVMPCCFELEVLETSALEDLALVSQVIEACREMGVLFALDDFGTGYSSLTYLKRLQVAQLKIDQSFVRDMFDDTDNLVILETMVSLATALRRQVIAEGVETVEHSQMLLQVCCDLAQGYYIARPMPAHELLGWSTAWRPDPTWSNLPCVKRENLPLLFASVNHRAWIVAIEAFLKGMHEASPPLDIHQCRFGQWLDTEALTRFGGQPNFQAIELLHSQVHTLAVELCELQAQGRTQEALTGLGELHGLRDALLEQLTLLQQSQQ